MGDHPTRQLPRQNISTGYIKSIIKAFLDLLLTSPKHHSNIKKQRSISCVSYLFFFPVSSTALTLTYTIHFPSPGISPRMPPKTFPHKLGIALFPFILGSGFYCLHGLGVSGGLFPACISILKDPSSAWPGTKASLVREFTGVTAIDGLITNLNLFIAHLVDWSDIPLSIFGFCMFGQYGVAFALVLLEGLREGNKGRIVSL